MNQVHESTAYRHDANEPEESGISVAHLVRTLRRYLPVFALTTGAVTLLYIIIAAGAYLLAPSVRTTMVQFRLDFEGAGEGRYPNGLKFSATDIIAAPILLHVHQSNNLGRFMKPEQFSRSVTVVESNPEYEKLATRYRARLSDTKLSPVDRERIEKEFDLALASIRNHSYALQYVHTKGKRPPETAIRKALLDILDRWAEVAINQHHVLNFDVAILSPQLVNDPLISAGNLVTGVQVLRSRVWRIAENVRALKALPGANLARTPDQISLAEIETRLDEIIRFRLEPLVGAMGPKVVEGTSTLQVLRNQLAYDERQLNAQRQRAEAIRQALSIYEQEREPQRPGQQAGAAEPIRSGAEAVTPQLSDSFLDRLVSLTSRSGDVAYRQRLADDYRQALADAIPLEESVAYDRQVIEQIQVPSAASRSADDLRNELTSVQRDLHNLVGKTNELYRIISRTLYPTSQLLTRTAPPISRVERSISVLRLALFGFLTILLTVVATVIGVLIHNRIQEEEADENRAGGDELANGAV